MEQNTRLWNLMAKKLAGESTALELNELNGILRSNPDAGLYMRVLSSWWRMTEANGPASGAAFERMLEKMDADQHRSEERNLLTETARRLFRMIRINL